MRKSIFALILLSPLILFSQSDRKTKSGIGLGLKAGLNFANVTKASSINSSNKTGFMAGVFLAPHSAGVLGYRTELIYSKQGYDFKTNTTTGSVTLDYILLPQLTVINIGKVAQLQLGAQIAFLINAKADSTNNQGTSNPYNRVMDFYNRFDYGAAAGVEIHPYKALLIGARYNISFGKTYQDPSNFTGPRPAFFPTFDAKNNVVQLFAGFTF
jgi:hypothetical protein